ncbi:hypothetical protein BGZ94_008127 [Podila epigama]|nr:hypothetical protein BGZ94_008127 [Podila epigama]
MWQIVQNRALLIGTLVLLVAGFTLYSSSYLDHVEFRFNRNHQLEQPAPSPSSSSTPSTTTLDPQQHDQHVDDNPNQNLHGHNNNGHGIPTGPVEKPPLLLTPNTQYITFLPFAGLTNQFIGLEKAAYIAMRLNRTLIVPPIISNTHDHDNTHQSWSRYFDLARFTTETGVPVVEWDTVRPLNPAQAQVGRDQALLGAFPDRPKPSPTSPEWSAVADKVKCHVIYGYGKPGKDINVSAQYFSYHFFLDLVFTDPPVQEAGATVWDHNRWAKDEMDPTQVVVVEDLIERFQKGFEKEQLLLLSHTFKLKDPQNQFWDKVGQFLHFQPELVEYAKQRVLQEVQGNMVGPVHEEDKEKEKEKEKEDDVNKHGYDVEENKGEDGNNGNDNGENPVQYIAVHLRRGDIFKKCLPKTHRSQCEVPISEFAKGVAQFRAANPAERKDWPVIVATDSNSPAEFAELKALAWHRMDHTNDDSVARLGAFGPALVDAALLAHADVLVGSEVSTMSRVAELRQRSWYHRKTIYPKPLPPPADVTAAAEGTNRTNTRRRNGKRRL